MHTPTPQTPIAATGHRTAARAIATLLAIAAAILLLAPSASAAPLDELELVELDDIFEPDIPLELDILDDLIVPPPVITASAEVDCTDAMIDVEIGNPTAAFVVFEVWIDDELVANPAVGPGLAWVDSFPAEENTTADVRVEGATTLLDTELAVDCLSADPWFEFIPNCAVGQAWVELGNNGPDVAMMGVHYEDLPFAPGLVLPGTSSVQPLAVAPNTFVAFSIEADGVAIHTDGYLFDCPVPEPEPTPAPVEPTPTPAAPVEVEPAGGHGPEVDTDTEVMDEQATAETDGTDETGTDADGTATDEADTDESGTDADEADTDGTEGEDTDVAIGADEVALAAGLETDGGSSGVSVALALLFTFGVVLMVGSVAAMKLRR